MSNFVHHCGRRSHSDDSNAPQGGSCAWTIESMSNRASTKCFPGNEARFQVNFFLSGDYHPSCGINAILGVVQILPSWGSLHRQWDPSEASLHRQWDPSEASLHRQWDPSEASLHRQWDPTPTLNFHPHTQSGDQSQSQTAPRWHRK